MRLQLPYSWSRVQGLGSRVWGWYAWMKHVLIVSKRSPKMQPHQRKVNRLSPEALDYIG